MKREIRVSSHKDYVAVDIVDANGKIQSTPFYLLPCKSAYVMVKDQEDFTIHKTEVKIGEDFDFLLFDDGTYKWEENFEVLLEQNYIKFINK